MPKDQLAVLTRLQCDRLAFFDLRVFFVEKTSRQDLLVRFGIQPTVAPWDLAFYNLICAIYQKRLPGNHRNESRMRAGILRVKRRAAAAEYVMRQGSCECSSDHSMRQSEYWLCLKNHFVSYDVSTKANS